MTTVDAHFNRDTQFQTRVRALVLNADESQTRFLVLGIDSEKSVINLYLTEEQLDSIGETILAHQSQRKRWSTARVIDNQLQEVKKEEDHGLCVP